MTKYISRNLGLDFIRATAILLVLFGHFDIISSPGNLHFYYQLGVYGVEIFFVLSGFLIGQIILKTFNKERSFRNLRTFWMRRWLRTLPLYYLVLILRELFYNPSGEIHYFHYLFLQDVTQFFGYDFLWFAESWSLAVEEWFYLIVPFILLFFPFSFKRYNISHVIIFIIGLITFIRGYYVINFDVMYNSEIRIFTPIRLDALLYGVLLANIKLQFNKLYHILQKWYIPLTVIILFIILNIIMPKFFIYNGDGIKTFPAVLGFSFISLFVALCIPFIENNVILLKVLSIRIIRKFIVYTSLFSYCIYLIHEIAYHEIVKTETDFSLNWWLLLLLALSISYGVSALSYYYFEKPILNFRDRLFKEK